MNTLRGIIDLGSNSVRLRIARLKSRKQFETVIEEREMGRLGGNIFSSGRIDEKTIQNTLSAMRRFKRILRTHRVKAPTIFATAAIRDAVNGEDVASRIRRILGAPVRILSAREEGEFLLRGARRRYALDRVNGLVVDLGGGSMQIVRTIAGLAVENVSLPLGALRLTERFGTGKSSTTGYNRMSAFVRKQLGGNLVVRKPACEFLAGAGGGFASCESMAEAIGIRGKIPRSEVVRQIRALRSASLDARKRMPGLEEKRIDIIVPSLCVIHEFMKLTRAKYFVNYGDGVRDGMFLEAVHGPEIESSHIVRSATELSARVPESFDHALQVRSLAVMISAAIERLDRRRTVFLTEHRAILESAALLHDVGVSINYADHHSWGARVVSSELLHPMTDVQRRMIALLVRTSRSIRIQFE